MKFWPLFMPTLLFLFSCSVPPHLTQQYAVPGHPAVQEVKNIIISAFGSVRFSGLVGIIRQEDGLYYVLLDATGIKLLEVRVKANGSYDLRHGIAKLAQSSLPQILSDALMRIYANEPLQKPCSNRFLYSLCRKKLDDDTTMKYFHIGPFTAWKVIYEMNQNSTITYSRPWFGITVQLSEAWQ